MPIFCLFTYLLVFEAYTGSLITIFLDILRLDNTDAVPVPRHAHGAHIGPLESAWVKF